MEGVRGQERSPGEFRYSQNWIGGQGSTLKNARYIPPSPDDMLDAMSDLEKYINADDEFDALIRSGYLAQRNLKSREITCDTADGSISCKPGRSVPGGSPS